MVEEHPNSEGHEEYDEEIDPELLGLASSRQRGSILRPVLFLVVIWFGVSIIADWQTQLSYFFSSSEPVEIGSVTEFATKRAQDPDWQPDIPHNRYVSLEGVPSRRAQSKRYNFFKLVGGPVYIEAKREDADKNELERKLDDDKKGEVDRTYFDGAGRALRLAELPDKYSGLRRYYYQRYNTRFCGMELPKKQQRALEAAAKEQGEAKDNCVDAYIIEADVEPMDHWWYLALSGLIGVFILLNIWWLIRWVRDFLRT